MEFFDLEAQNDDSTTGSNAGELSSLSTDLSGFIASEGTLSDACDASAASDGEEDIERNAQALTLLRGALPAEDGCSDSGASCSTTGTIEPSRGRAFVFTWNNYEPVHEESLRKECEGSNVRYCCFGREKAPTTGTPHLQGVLYFRNPRVKRGVINFFRRIGGNGVYIEPMRGSLAQAIAYSKKDGDFWEHGIPPKDAGSRVAAGKREKKRWASIRAACEAQQYADLPDDFVCRYPGNPQRIFQLALAAKATKERDVLENYWLWGETGTGKSRSARAWCRAKGYSVYLKDATKWWDNYNGEDVTLIEEFGPEEAKTLGQLLKRWTDHYPFPGEIKCAPSRPMRPPIVIVTSNFSIEELFPLSRDYEPFLRRFRVFQFVKDQPNPFFNL